MIPNLFKTVTKSKSNMNKLKRKNSEKGDDFSICPLFYTKSLQNFTIIFQQKFGQFY